MKLNGRVSLITGAASGIGKASATLFADEGAKVIVADVDRVGAEGVVKEIIDSGGEAMFVESDVSRSRDVERMVRMAVEEFGKLDILFNNAGIGMHKPFDETSEDDWDRVIDVNLKGVFLGCKHAVPQMLKQGGGVIVNTASEIGLVGARNYAAYCASKGGVIQLTRALALELSDKKIRVICLCPGVTSTPLLERGIRNSPDPEARRASLIEGVPLRRIATPEEIARGALFLASDDSSFMTGAVLVMDGGATAG